MSSPYEGMTAVLYARVSTEKATENKRQDTRSQLLELSRWCKENCVTVVGEFADEISGGTIDRPEIDRMVGRITKGGVTMILALHPDRISRDMAGKSELLARIKPYGTVIRCLSDLSIKPETEDGRLIDTMHTYGGQKYISGHGIKIKAGFKRVREQGTKSGKPIGRPPAVVDLDLAMECADNRNSVAEAAKLMGVGRETLRRKLIKSGRITEFYERLSKAGGSGSNPMIVENAGRRYLSPKPLTPKNSVSSNTLGENGGGA